MKDQKIRVIANETKCSVAIQTVNTWITTSASLKLRSLVMTDFFVFIHFLQFLYRTQVSFSYRSFLTFYRIQQLCKFLKYFFISSQFEWHNFSHYLFFFSPLPLRKFAVFCFQINVCFIANKFK